MAMTELSRQSLAHVASAEILRMHFETEVLSTYQLARDSLHQPL